jgi:putative flippase GtrA
VAALTRQVVAYAGVGLASTALHYAILIALVQGAGVAPVPAALCGFTAGGLCSYALNRRVTFASDRPHSEAVWRFTLVASVAFLLTYLLMRQMVEAWHVPYLLAQAVTTALVMVWTFCANRIWTFREVFDTAAELTASAPPAAATRGSTRRSRPSSDRRSSRGRRSG